MDIPSGMRIEKEFYDRTEAALDRLCAELAHGKSRHNIGTAWFYEMRKTALLIFDEVTLPCMTRRDPKVITNIIKGRRSLTDRFNIVSKSSASLRAMLEMEEAKAA